MIDFDRKFKTFLTANMNSAFDTYESPKRAYQRPIRGATHFRLVLEISLTSFAILWSQDKLLCYTFSLLTHVGLIIKPQGINN